MPTRIWYEKAGQGIHREKKTTRAYPLCPSPNQVSPPGSYRLSFESGFKSDCKTIPREPLAGNQDVADIPKDLRGRGVDGVMWFCLACFENLWDETGWPGGPEPPTRPPPPRRSNPVYSGFPNVNEFLQGETDLDENLFMPTLYRDLNLRLSAEDRFHRPATGYYELSDPELKCFYKWKAVHCHAQIMSSSFNRGFAEYTGIAKYYPEDEDGVGEVYMNTSQEEFVGQMSVGKKRIVEVDARDIKGKKLSEAMELLDKMVSHWLQVDGWVDDGPKPKKAKGGKKKKRGLLTDGDDRMGEAGDEPKVGDESGNESEAGEEPEVGDDDSERAEE